MTMMDGKCSACGKTANVYFRGQHQIICDECAVKGVVYVPPENDKLRTP